jgi:hypothetical protein
MDRLHETGRIGFVASLTEMIEDYPLVTTPDRTCPPFDDWTCRKVLSARKLQIGPSVNWKKFLGYDASMALDPDAQPGERLMDPPVIAGDVAYFTTYTPDAIHPCDPGIIRLYGTTFDEGDPEGDCATLAARLSNPEDPGSLLLFRTVP